MKNANREVLKMKQNFSNFEKKKLVVRHFMHLRDPEQRMRQFSQFAEYNCEENLQL